jgi:hypothetical protein
MGPSLPDPAGRASMGAGYDPGSGKIYLVGGYWNGHDGDVSDQNWEFDPVAGSYTERAPLPNRGFGYASGMLGGLFHVLGGNRFIGEENLTWDYDVTNNTWTRWVNVPTSLWPSGDVVAACDCGLGSRFPVTCSRGSPCATPRSPRKLESYHRGELDWLATAREGTTRLVLKRR